MLKIHHRTVLAWLAAAALLAPGLAAAQDNGAAASNPDRAKAQKLVQQYRATATKLGQIRQKAIKATPSLKTKGKAYQVKLSAAMDKAGYDVDAGRQRMQKIGTELKGGNVKADRKRELVNKLRTEESQARQAQIKALQQPDVQKAREDLRSSTLAAMRKQDPKTDALIARIQSLQGQLQALAKKHQGDYDRGK